MDVTLQYNAYGRTYSSTKVFLAEQAVHMYTTDLFLAAAHMFADQHPPVTEFLRTKPSYCVRADLERKSVIIQPLVNIGADGSFKDVLIRVVCYENEDVLSLVRSLVQACTSTDSHYESFPKQFHVSGTFDSADINANIDVADGSQGSLLDYCTRIVQAYVLAIAQRVSEDIRCLEFKQTSSGFWFSASLRTEPENVVCLTSLDSQSSAGLQCTPIVLPNDLPKIKPSKKDVNALLSTAESMLADGEQLSKRAKRKLSAARSIVRDTGALIGPRVTENCVSHRTTLYTCVTKNRGAYVPKQVEHTVNVADFHKNQIVTVFSQLPALAAFAVGPNFYVKTGRTTAVQVHSQSDSSPCSMKKITFSLKTKVMASTRTKFFL